MVTFTYTSNLNLAKPNLDAADEWGAELNSNFDTIDANLGPIASVNNRLAAVELMQRAAAIQGRRKPDIKDITIEELRRRQNQKFGTVSVVEAGGDGEGVVFGSHLDVNGGATEAAAIAIGIPIDAAGDYDLSVTIEAIGSASLSDVSVERAVYEPMSSGGAQVADVAMTESPAGTWTGTSTIAAENIGNEVAIKIYTTAGAGKYIIRSYSITDTTSTVFDESNTEFFDDAVITFSRGESGRGVYSQIHDSGLVSRTKGVYSGKLPLCVYTGPSGANDGPATPFSAFENEALGYRASQPIWSIQAWYMAMTFAQNDLQPPAVIFLPGSYSNPASSGSGFFDMPSTAVFSEAHRFYAGCPYGTATLTSGTSSTGIKLEQSSSAGVIDVCLANIETDNSITTPFQFDYVNAYCYRCDCDGSGPGLDGFEMDNNDFILQECVAQNVSNDGFNHHGFGHGVLVDCQALNNTDDGFSPHDNCTYEVWGGTYDGNGKGNIIPAFGAQGICVGVTSKNLTGASPRLGPSGGYAGFIALGSSEYRPTTMMLIDCKSISDPVGVAADGQSTIVAMVGGAVTTPTENHFANRDWEAASGTTGFAGNLDILKVITSSRTIDSDDTSKVREFGATVLE